jgi:hypothetical protein
MYSHRPRPTRYGRLRGGRCAAPASATPAAACSSPSSSSASSPASSGFVGLPQLPSEGTATCPDSARSSCFCSSVSASVAAAPCPASTPVGPFTAARRGDALPLPAAAPVPPALRGPRLREWGAEAALLSCSTAASPTAASSVAVDWLDSRLLAMRKVLLDRPRITSTKLRGGSSRFTISHLAMGTAAVRAGNGGLTQSRGRRQHQAGGNWPSARAKPSARARLLRHAAAKPAGCHAAGASQRPAAAHTQKLD